MRVLIDNVYDVRISTTLENGVYKTMAYTSGEIVRPEVTSHTLEEAKIRTARLLKMCGVPVGML